MSCGPFFSLGAGLGLFDRDVEDSGDMDRLLSSSSDSGSSFTSSGSSFRGLRSGRSMSMGERLDLKRSAGASDSTLMSTVTLVSTFTVAMASTRQADECGPCANDAKP